MPKKPEPNRVRSWPFLTLSMRPEELAEWSALARSLGRSRADLLREVLEQVGLPYAKAMVRHRGLGHRGDSSAPSSAVAGGETNRTGDAVAAVYAVATGASSDRRSA